MARTTITAPRSGYVIVTATVFLSTSDTSAPSTPVGLQIHQEGSSQISRLRSARVGTGPGAVSDISVSLTEVFGVAPGSGDLTFALEGASGGALAVTAIQPYITALFVPSAP